MVSFTHPANEHASPAPPGVPFNPLPGTAPFTAVVITIPLDRIAESPFNPRKDFPKESIAELADSIKARGLLEPLVVRPTKKPEHYELMAGHRRLRALKLNGAPGALCNVIRADDGQARATLIVENLQREDLGPMEEAEAFHALHLQDPKAWSVTAIAQAVGKTPRFVQQRLAIAGGLSAPLKKRFVEGRLSVEAARIVAPLPASIQNALPDWATENSDSDQLRRQIFELCIPESAAKFDVALYKGEFMEDGKKRRYFPDAVQFRKLQRPAAEKKLEEVRQEWPKAQLVDLEAIKGWLWADETWAFADYNLEHQSRPGDQPRKYAVPKEKCTALVWIAGNGEIRKALGVCRGSAIEAAGKRRSASSVSRGPVNEKAAHKKERVAFNDAVAKGATGKPDFAARLQLLVRLSGAELTGEQRKLLPAAIADCELARWKQRDKDRAGIWRAIAAMPIAEVERLAKKIAMGDLPEWETHEWRQKPILLVAIAETAGVAIPEIALSPAEAKKLAKAKGEDASTPPAKARAKAAKKKHQ